MKQIGNGICVALAFLFLMIGMIGILLPILPTTPFFLLSGACFAKGSKRFHQWFMSTNLYRKYMKQTFVDKAMSRKSKVSVLGMISAVLLIGFLFSPVWYAKVVILLVAVGHYYYFLFRIKTIEKTKIEQGGLVEHE